MSETRIELRQMPSALSGYLKAVVAGGRKRGGRIPQISAQVRGVTAEAQKVARYAAICGFDESTTLPPTYPHVLAAPLHLTVLTQPAFPYKLLGAVHVRNDVTQHRAIRLDETLDVTVGIGKQEEVELGVEFGLVTRIIDAKGQCPWESVSTNLIRTKRPPKDKKSSWTPPDFSAHAEIARWTADGGIGRRYGVQAGDVNPIHLHPLAAKPFGFPRAIAHGMWSFARCAAETTRGRAAQPLKLAVAFKRPVLLPSECVLLARSQGATTDYLLTDRERKTVFLSGVTEILK